MNGKKIGVLDSAMVDVLNRFLEDKGVKADILLYSEHEKLFDAIDAEDFDVLVAESDGAYGRDHAQVLYSFGGSDYYLCVSKERPDLLAKVNQSLTF